MSTLQKSIIGVVLLIAVFMGGRFSKPTEVKEVIKYAEKTETKEEKNKNINKDKVTIIKKTKNVDGSETTETRIEDKTKITEETKKESETSKTMESTKITKNDLGLTIQAMVIVYDSGFKQPNDYGGYVKYRVIGNISVGASYTTKKEGAVYLGMDF